MPKVRTKSGQTKHFGYDAKGRAAAARAVKQGGKKVMKGKK